MPLPPGHYREIEEQAKAYHETFRNPRHRVVVVVGAVLSILLIALVVISLASKQKRSAHGCIDFSYSTMVGGAEMYKCGTAASELCSTPHDPSDPNPGFYKDLMAACRRAGLPTPAA